MSGQTGFELVFKEEIKWEITFFLKLELRKKKQKTKPKKKPRLSSKRDEQAAALREELLGCVGTFLQ